MQHTPEIPHFLDVFLSPIRDNPQAQAALMALLILIVLDVALGFAAACRNGDVRSSVMREGVWHKTGEIGVVAIADIMDGLLGAGIDIGYSAPITTGIIVLLCVNECVSCMENAAKLDPELEKSKALGILYSALSTQQGSGNTESKEG